MAFTGFRNHLRFALRKESFSIRQEIPLNQLEKIGNILAWCVYEFRQAIAKVFCDPRFLTIFLTACAMTFAAIVFYPSYTLLTLLDFLISMILKIEWGYIRFSLWLLSEITILGLGIRSFGRFSNRKLMVYHGLTV